MEGDDSTTTILITGSTGNIGSEIIKQLSATTSNLDLKAAVRSEDASINNNNNNKSKNSSDKQKDKGRVQQQVVRIMIDQRLLWRV